jgi:D-alanine-D-alanine ligase-like ATP-grasp enzyme
MSKVALVFNLIRPEMLRGKPLDAVAELDTEPTIEAIEAALQEGGHEVVRIEADTELYDGLRKLAPDIVFNIAEGVRGESRESQVPAICEFLGIPYTGSGVLTTALCLNKARAKQVLAQHGLSTPAYTVMTGPAHGSLTLRFPLIVKLLHEGSSMGLTLDSVVDDLATLNRQVIRLVSTYRQPALVEEFIDGREFTVAVLGNETVTILPIVEIEFSHPRGINLFQPDDPLLAMLTLEERERLAIARLHEARCPAALDLKLDQRIRETAERAYRALDCRDWCRMEMRLGRDGKLYLLELNPIAGIDPSYLLPRAAAAAGWSYARLINEILNHALERLKSAIKSPITQGSAGTPRRPWARRV